MKLGSSFSISHPNFQDVWAQGNEYTLEWGNIPANGGAEIGGTFDIDLSDDGGVSWIRIASGVTPTFNGSSCSYVQMIDGSPTRKARIRITSCLNSTLIAYSDFFRLPFADGGNHFGDESVAEFPPAQ